MERPYIYHAEINDELENFGLYKFSIKRSYKGRETGTDVLLIHVPDQMEGIVIKIQQPLFKKHCDLQSRHAIQTVSRTIKYKLKSDKASHSISTGQMPMKKVVS